jgi:alpha-beta hydrolase superfamily lysophospholipase
MRRDLGKLTAFAAFIAVILVLSAVEEMLRYWPLLLALAGAGVAVVTWRRRSRSPVRLRRRCLAAGPGETARLRAENAKLRAKVTSLTGALDQAWERQHARDGDGR